MSKESTNRSGFAPLTEADPVSSGGAFLILLLIAGVSFLAASLLGLISSIKFHQPNFLADCAWLTYGRVRPAYLNLLVYGGCLPAGVTVGLWILSRLGQQPLPNGLMLLAGGLFWNLGVAIGTVGILIGDRTGFENFEMPTYGIWVCLFGYLVWAIAATASFRARLSRETFVSQWYLFAAAFWFPWIYTTAALLLASYPVRGIMQAVIGWWFSVNLLVVWMSLVGLSVAFYLLPKILCRDLYSHPLALLAFWCLVLFGSWSGIPKSAPVPAWMVTLSGVATVLSVFALVAVALNFFYTSRGGSARNTELSFVRFGLYAFVGAGFMRIGSALGDRALNLDFTWFATSAYQLQAYGFFAMTVFGAAYWLAPRLIREPLPWPGLVRAHFWLAASGTLLIVVPLGVGGIIESAKLADAQRPFLEVMHSTLMGLRLSTLGDLLLVLGHGLFVLNLSGQLFRAYKAHAGSVYASAVAPVEVKP